MRGGTGIDWVVPLSTLESNIEGWWTRAEGRLESEIASAGQQIRAFAQASHPWRNVTGQAEAQLNYQVERNGDVITLTVYQGAPHGLWLEVRWGGRWGILPKAMTAGYPLVTGAIRRALGG